MKKLKLNIQLFAVSHSLTCETVSQDIENNESIVRLTFNVVRTSGVTFWQNKNQLSITCVYKNDNNEDVSQTKYVTFEFPQSVNSKSTSVEFTVKHKSDGTQKINYNSSISTGTSAGTIKDSGSKVLQTLHKSPIITLQNIQELNTLLNVNSDTFVENLSAKLFTVSFETFDSSTIEKYELIYNGYVYTSYDNTLYINFGTTSMIVEDNKIRFEIKAYDSLGGIGTLNLEYSDVVLYNKVAIEPTNSSAKRDGQTSGKVKISAKGTFTNSTIGTKVNKAKVFYKFWEKGAEESQNWLEVSQESVSIDENNVNVYSYQIGTTDTTAPNYFDYQKSYIVKIKIADDYSFEETEKIITVGEPVWTEYKDRVDFKKITICGNEIIENGEDSNGKKWIKYADGTMICHYIDKNVNLNINSSWGSMYTKTYNLPNYPQEFIEVPTTTVTLLNNETSKWAGWLGASGDNNSQNPSTTSPGSVLIIRPTSANGNFTFDVVAVGKWK